VEVEAIRQEATREVRQEIGAKLQGPEAFARHFETCIVCHNCMEQCPVCYCNECFFESQTFRYEGDKMMLWARNRGALAMPTDKAMFHLGRMAHMVATCIGCGMCAQACPVDINVGRVFKYVASQVQPEFDYKAGLSIDDPLPQATYLEDELEPR
jgi:formate dehydrogenase subunit beta